MMVVVGSCCLCVKHVAPLMKAQGGGSIVNNGSTAAVTNDGSSALYCAGKAAILNLTRVWATELAPHRVRCNCVSPGAVVTPIFWGGHQRLSPSENEQKRGRLVRFFEHVLPQGRAGAPADVAFAVLHLASDESAHTTGQNLMVDAGLTATLNSREELQTHAALRRTYLAGQHDD